MLATKSDLREFREDPTLVPIVLLCKGDIFVSTDMTPLSIGVSNVLQEFSDVFPEEVPSGLPPLWGIEHQIDLIPGATLPNRAPYRTNPEGRPGPLRRRLLAVRPVSASDAVVTEQGVDDGDTSRGVATPEASP